MDYLQFMTMINECSKVLRNDSFPLNDRMKDPIWSETLKLLTRDFGGDVRKGFEGFRLHTGSKFRDFECFVHFLVAMAFWIKRSRTKQKITNEEAAAMKFEIGSKMGLWLYGNKDDNISYEQTIENFEENYEERSGEWGTNGKNYVDRTYKPRFKEILKRMTNNPAEGIHLGLKVFLKILFSKKKLGILEFAEQTNEYIKARVTLARRSLLVNQPWKLEVEYLDKRRIIFVSAFGRIDEEEEKFLSKMEAIDGFILNKRKRGDDIPKTIAQTVPQVEPKIIKIGTELLKKEFGSYGDGFVNSLLKNAVQLLEGVQKLGDKNEYFVKDSLISKKIVLVRLAQKVLVDDCSAKYCHHKMAVVLKYNLPASSINWELNDTINVANTGIASGQKKRKSRRHWPNKPKDQPSHLTPPIPVLNDHSSIVNEIPPLDNKPISSRTRKRKRVGANAITYYESPSQSLRIDWDATKLDFSYLSENEERLFKKKFHMKKCPCCLEGFEKGKMILCFLCSMYCHANTTCSVQVDGGTDGVLYTACELCITRGKFPCYFCPNIVEFGSEYDVCVCKINNPNNRMAIHRKCFVDWKEKNPKMNCYCEKEGW